MSQDTNQDPWHTHALDLCSFSPSRAKWTNQSPAQCTVYRSYFKLYPSRAELHDQGPRTLLRRILLRRYLSIVQRNSSGREAPPADRGRNTFDAKNLVHIAERQAAVRRSAPVSCTGADPLSSPPCDLCNSKRALTSSLAAPRPPVSNACHCTTRGVGDETTRIVFQLL